MSDQKPREIAGRILNQRTAGADFVENLLDRALARSRISGADRGLCQELVYGVARWQATLDWLIARKTSGRTQTTALQNLLRLGLYQIFWLDRIPNHAAVNETVEQARRDGFGPQSGFVNAVLRGYLREADATRQLLEELKTTQPHIGYSHPEWLVARWQKRWGAEKTARLMEWNNTPPKTYARINSLRFEKFQSSNPRDLKTAVAPRRRFLERNFNDAGDVLEQWRDEQVDYDFVRGDWFDDNLVFALKSHPPLSTLPSFQHGLFYVQDPSTLLSVNELDPQPGETVLDLCAAPGGKTTYIAQLMENRGKIVAHDTSPERLKLVEENGARLGVTCVQRAPAIFPTEQFDRILVDAPCSNTGVMRRRVDLRWRIRPEEIERLRTTQLELLRQAARLLKPDGTLIYSTCSLEPEENREIVKQFADEHGNFEVDYERELLPFVESVDGAFVARLIRKAT
ncbi:MAG TPA: 16S rRNA (cytosine(967)-C(5))-methyltransferase RsmB [Verrucomicrobiae bacterium]|nr:16S rRNA (cytosine(967)-C(5))-methyltransferase RsmB [Verrucomicrobiae bacterium]